MKHANALERAAELAARQGAPLYVLHRPGNNTPHPIDPYHRLALRSLQLGRRHGIEVMPLHLSQKGLARMLQRKAQELLLVVDANTVNLLLIGSGVLSSLLMGTLRGSRLLDHSAGPILVVKRPIGERGKLALLPYQVEHDAARSLAFARALAPDRALEMFFIGPKEVDSHVRPMRREAVHLKEWPPPASPAHGAEGIKHSDYLSTRLNRAIPAFDTASTARRIKNQARFSAAGVVIAPYVASSWGERLCRTSLRDRLVCVFQRT